MTGLQKLLYTNNYLSIIQVKGAHHVEGTDHRVDGHHVQSILVVHDEVDGPEREKVPVYDVISNRLRLIL